MSGPLLSIIIPTRNPDRARLEEVLAGLARQTAAPADFELCLVDNGSSPPVDPTFPPGLRTRVIREERAGLLWARMAGIRNTEGELLAFIDDDTVPDADFVKVAVEFMQAHPALGTA